MRRLVIDLDGTITDEDPSIPYPDKRPNQAIIEQIKHYHALGFEVIIHTARNMRTFSGSLGKINAVTLPIIIEWLRANDVPYDEIHVGKPWCGTEGFYVDDRAIRPDEFLTLSLAEIHHLIGRTSAV